MSALDAKIDDLYRQPLNDFTSARNALAKSLTGADAQRVRALAKPTVVPWAVNQVYWRARAAYDRLMKSGERLRKAQIAALEGHAADVRTASDGASSRHRRRGGGSRASRGAAGAKSRARMRSARTFEALSLATNAPDSAGPPDRCAPACGVRSADWSYAAARDAALVEAARGLRPREHTGPLLRTGGADRDLKRERADARSCRARSRSARQAPQARRPNRRAHQAAVKEAEAELARVAAAERKAREVWERAHDTLLEARRRLTAVKSGI